jgi:HSP20 family protein
LEDLRIENKMEKAMKPIPVPYEDFESSPKHVEELIDLIARRPFELLEKRPFLLNREFENLFKTEPEQMRPIYLKLYETEEALVARAEVPGFTEKELNIVAEPWRPGIAGGREWKEEGKLKDKKQLPLHTERMHIYKTVKFPVEIKPDGVKAILKNGILEITLPKAEVVKEGEDRGQTPLAQQHHSHEAVSRSHRRRLVEGQAASCCE